jgi:hypothetical protein
MNTGLWQGKRRTSDYSFTEAGVGCALRTRIRFTELVIC